jgi:hypothetical protein
MGFPGSGLGSGIEETLADKGFFGERGGTRTLDPMIKSHVLNANPKFAVQCQSASRSEVRPTNGFYGRQADIPKHDL